MSNPSNESEVVLNVEDLDRVAALLTGRAFRESFLQDPRAALAKAGVTGLPEPVVDHMASMSSEELTTVAELASFLKGFKLPPDISSGFM